MKQKDSIIPRELCERDNDSWLLPQFCIPAKSIPFEETRVNMRPFILLTQSLSQL